MTIETLNAIKYDATALRSGLLNMAEKVSLVEAEGVVIPDWSRVYDINGLKFQACSINFEGYGFDSRQVSIDPYRVKEKSQEEIAAEEAVRKAQESLKAAEEVLNKVKKNGS